jgi:hypothetical protein
VTTFPFDLLIFLRSGSSTQPLMLASLHGRRPKCCWARSTEENSHVRMISGPCGRRSIGKVRSKRSGSSSHPQTMSGVSDEVSHVSMTSGSPVNPPGASRWSGR